MDSPLWHCLEKQNDGNWEKLDPKPKKVALKRLYNMLAEYLN